MPMVTPDPNKLDETHDFGTGTSGASTTYPVKCSALRKGGYVILRERPCKIVDLATSKTGKHGHAKVLITGLEIFTGKKIEEVCPSTHNMLVPNITRKEYEVVSMSRDAFITVMCDNGTLRSDLQLTEICNPSKQVIIEEMLGEVEDGIDRIVQATVWGAMGIEIIKDIRIVKG